MLVPFGRQAHSISEAPSSELSLLPHTQHFPWSGSGVRGSEGAGGLDGLGDKGVILVGRHAPAELVDGLNASVTSLPVSSEALRC
mmetsp:Transcript_20135/g.51894  ORF Transcript_20135/g.51894 Transcript_20135/m.51894 type:complete len:85 (+) Transcript_20135:935-1189(+)